MKKSFLNASEPFVTVMVQVPTGKQAEIRVRNAVAAGATAIGVQMRDLQKQYRDEQTLRGIFAAADGKPVYVTNYRGEKNADMTDEERMQELLFALDCGATLLDIPGDTFDPSPEELTKDAVAIKKQIELINEIHNRGGEVLMSSHVYRFRCGERVLEMANEQQRRGADIVKIVTGAENEEEELENLRICNLLKKELKIPFLFLSTGKHSYLHRTVGPALGACMWLCFCEYDEFTYPGPPLLKNVLQIKRGLNI